MLWALACLLPVCLCQRQLPWSLWRVKGAAKQLLPRVAMFLLFPCCAQVDLGVRGGGAAVVDGMQPLPLLVTEHALRQLAAAWTALETLDLSGFGPDTLPESALTGVFVCVRLVWDKKGQQIV